VGYGNKRKAPKLKRGMREHVSHFPRVPFNPRKVLDHARYLPALLGRSGPRRRRKRGWPGTRHLHKSFHDSSDDQRTRRNHLIRRGMAESLRDALLQAQIRFGDDIPSGLRESFFKYWPALLDNAQTDDELVELLFPLEDAEDQLALLYWSIQSKNHRFDDVLA
jgi:hypothetical protein